MQLLVDVLSLVDEVWEEGKFVLVVEVESKYIFLWPIPILE
jgi:hypothetical protein